MLKELKVTGDVRYTHYMSGEISFIIDKIDMNKKYKLAIPLQKEIKLNSMYTMNVKLK